MGVVIRQSIKGSIYSYLGAVIGFVNVGLLMPLLFDTNQVGLINILLAMSSIMAQFGSLGFVNVTTRLFPYFRKGRHYHGFAKLFLLFSFLGLTICLAAFFLLKNYIIATNIEKSPLLVENVYYLIPMILASLYYILFDGYLRMLYKASASTFLKDLFLRILIFAGLGLFYLGILDFKGFLQFYIIAFAAPAVIMFGYLLKTGEFSLQGSFKNMKTVLRKDIVNVALFGIISGFSRIAILNIDKYMVNHFLDLNATGIYAIAFFFGSMILVPGRALRRISSTVISEAHKSKDNNKMYDVYEKSSLSMFTVGAGLFVLIWGNINNIFNILPDVYETGKWVIFFIGLAYVINMLSGIGNQIILYSKYYRHHSFIMLGALVFIVTLNIVLIPVYGMNGAAMATFLTILAERLFKWWFVYKRFGMQPYHSKHIMILLASVVIYFVSRLIPSISLIPDIIIRSALIIGLFLVFSKTFKVSLELNAIIDKIIQMASGKKRK